MEEAHNTKIRKDMAVVIHNHPSLLYHTTIMYGFPGVVSRKKVYKLGLGGGVVSRKKVYKLGLGGGVVPRKTVYKLGLGGGVVSRKTVYKLGLGGVYGSASDVSRASG